MTARPTLRILMALVLAAAAPMWCQCMIDAVSASAGSSGMSESAPLEIVCCSESCGDETPFDNSCSCECCDEHAAAAVSATHAVDCVLVHVELARVDSIVLPDPVRTLMNRRAGQGADPPELASSLLSQRCLLVI